MTSDDLMMGEWRNPQTRYNRDKDRDEETPERVILVERIISLEAELRYWRTQANYLLREREQGWPEPGENALRERVAELEEIVARQNRVLNRKAS